MFFEGGKWCIWEGQLHACDLDQPHFAGDKPEAQSFRFYSWAIHFFILSQTSFPDVSGNGI